MKLNLFFTPASQLVILYRLYSWLYPYIVTKPISYTIYYISRMMFSSDIHPAAKIGRNFSIRHHFGIVIGKNVIIGDNFIVYNGVSIGQRNVNDSGMPRIGDNCIFYTGAVVVGNGVVEDGTILAANKVIILK
ncbi:hypothetical protein [Vibrio harveyi]|uniref:hypothetical protein n=1 Tax=Vibrio harveyi TaxID=669 RepID=UPI002B3E1845|nr:hypothetical protein [Vibrio harveyi]HEQ3594968.1 hypothetical protein [Vibrio harveyi]HEQ3606889.1 hypothetical protein [Vibrio harveyi]